MSKEEYEELCKLLISFSEEDFELGKTMFKNLKMRWGTNRLINLDMFSKHVWWFNTNRSTGLYRKPGMIHPDRK